MHHGDAAGRGKGGNDERGAKCGCFLAHTVHCYTALYVHTSVRVGMRVCVRAGDSSQLFLFTDVTDTL